jgi:hypothetical protein
VILADPAADADLAASGFTTIPLLDPAAAAVLRDRWAAQDDGTAPPFDSGLVGDDAERKRRVHGLVVEALGPAVAVAVRGHRPLVGSFAVKRPSPESAMPVHQDWCVVDERRWRSISVWCALDDVTGDRGPLAFVPGSHLDAELRGSGFPAPATADGPFVEVPLRPGEAAVYFHATVHRSGPNTSPAPRVGAMLGLVPEAAPAVHLHLVDGVVEVRRAETDFYLDYAFGEAPLPASAVVLERFSR